MNETLNQKYSKYSRSQKKVRTFETRTGDNETEKKIMEIQSSRNFRLVNFLKF